MSDIFGHDCTALDEIDQRIALLQGRVDGYHRGNVEHKQELLDQAKSERSADIKMLSQWAVIRVKLNQ